MLALTLDAPFQAAVNAALTLDHDASSSSSSSSRSSSSLLVGGSVTSGGIKGYERMWNKMMSADDHYYEPKPRPAANVDVVRCLATFATPADMRAGFERLQVSQ
jgi:hypothetical protein